MKRQLFMATVAIASFGMFAQRAHAHAHSIGFENAGPGAVSIWLGTYQHGGHHNEGSMQLQGVNGTSFGPIVSPFNLLVNAKPAGLIDGTTNFYVSGAGNAPLVGSETTWLTSVCPACGPANHWQGATFSGLAAGDYQFTWIPIANPSAEWSPYANAMNGVFTLTGAVVNPPTTSVPEPTTLSLLGLGLLGFASRAWRRRQA